MLFIKKSFFGVFWRMCLVNLVAVCLPHFYLLSWVEKAYFGNPYYMPTHYLNGAGGLDRHCFPCRGVVENEGRCRKTQARDGRQENIFGGELTQEKWGDVKEQGLVWYSQRGRVSFTAGSSLPLLVWHCLSLCPYFFSFCLCVFCEIMCFAAGGLPTYLPT